MLALKSALYAVPSACFPNSKCLLFNSALQQTCKRTLATTQLGIYSKGAPLKGENDDAWSVHTGALSTTIVVADGVSAWRKVGVDPSVFPRRLALLIADHAEILEQQTQASPDPHRLLELAFDQMQLENDIAGSCTVCVGVIDKFKRTMTAVSLGDCGLLQMRNGDILHKSVEQYIAQNVPYQLGINLRKTNRMAFQRPCDAVETHLQLVDGDFIMLATDGLFDNLWPDEIAYQVGPLQAARMKGRGCLDRGAKRLVSVAHETALNGMQSVAKRHTPFMSKSYGNSDDSLVMAFDGNVDDTTVCLVEINGKSFNPAVESATGTSL